MQRTLLDFTQEVLSSMGSDEVNSINDTLESQSVSKIVRRSFYNIVDRTTLPVQKNTFSLDASTDNAKPTLMTKPADVRNIEWVKYDKQDTANPYLTLGMVEYLEPEDFTNYIYRLNTTESNVEAFVNNGINILYRNDRAPKFYTSFDDTTLFFDAYDSAVDTTLQKSKTLCYGEKLFSFSLTDAFLPPINDEQQNLLLNDAISLAWLELKQAPNQKAEGNSRRGFIHQQKAKQTIPARIDPLSKAVNYGRK